MRRTRQVVWRAAALGLLALTVGPAARAQQTQQVTAEVDAEAEKVLRGMADYFKNLDGVSVRAEVDVQRTFQGRKMNVQRAFRFSAQRPNRFAMRPKGEGRTRSGTAVSDGEHLFLHSPRAGKYTKGASPEKIDGLRGNRMLNSFSGGTAEFVSALMSENPYRALLSDARRVVYEGTDKLGGAEHHRVRIVNRRLPTQLWVRADAQRPVPAKLKPDFSKLIERARQEGQDVDMEMTLRFTDWSADPEWEDGTFAFSPPDGAQKVDSLAQGRDGPGPKQLLGKAAPDFTLAQLGGGNVTLSDLKGERIVILDFWATWCGPCVRAMPKLTDVAAAYRDKGVVLYGVNQREDAQTIRDFLEKQDYELNVLLDKNGQVAGQYNVRGIPQTVIVGKGGKVQAVHVGFDPQIKQKLSSELDKLLAGKSLTE